MNKLLKIIRREYITRVRSKAFIIGTILGPIFTIGISVAPVLLARAPAERQRTLAVVDLSRTLGDRLHQALDDTLKGGRARYLLISAAVEGDLESTKRRLNADMDHGVIHAYIVIPEDVLDRGRVDYYAKAAGDPEETRRLRETINRVVVTERLQSAGLDAEKVRGLMKGIELRTIKVQEGQERKGGFLSDYVGTFAFVMILYFAILFHSASLMHSIIEDKSSRVIEVLLSSVTPSQLMGGKILGVGAVGLTQSLVWVLSAAGASAYGFRVLATDAPFPALSVAFLAFFFVFFVLGFLLFATLYVGAGALCNSAQEAQSFVFPITMMLVVPMMTMGAVIRQPDSGLSVALSLIPFFSPITMFIRINLLTPPAYQIALSILLLLLTLLFLIRLIARVFRVGILMYGKRPTLPEIVRWMRTA
ncbi:MAG: ABC transporter permease [Candidatus Latescibacteria bacterium]|nr:ABC transporter permease [Candidatus Latescibacterota bacterium]